MEPFYKNRLRVLEKEITKINIATGYTNKPAKFFPPEKDKFLDDTLDFGKDFTNSCVNQFGICE